MSRRQFHGQDSAFVAVPVPAAVREQARLAFRLRALGFRGATETGWRRARQLASEAAVPLEDVRFMRNWFARHVSTSLPGFRSWERAGRPTDDASWHGRRSVLAWLTWGGDAGLAWVNEPRILALLNRHFGKRYAAIHQAVE